MKTRYKCTLDDYHQLIETGFLDEKPVELLEGELIEMSPQRAGTHAGVPHSFTNHNVADYLRSLLKSRAFIREAYPITLDNSEPEPDIAIAVENLLLY